MRTATDRDLTLADVPVGTKVRVAYRDIGIHKDWIGCVGVVTKQNYVRVVVTIAIADDWVFDIVVRPLALELFEEGRK